MSRKLALSWPIEYAAEHAELCRIKECERQDFRFQSPQIQSRPYLVCWIGTVAEKFQVCTCTLHLAVFIMDTFMDNHTIDLDRLHLVALVCLLVAAKYEERDVGIPKINELNSVVNCRYTTIDFQGLEIMILSFLDWNLNLPTAAHFAEYYSLYTVSRKDWDTMEYTSYESFWKEARRLVQDYLNRSLIDVRMLQFMPSLVAATCIFLARQQLNLSTKWSNELITVTKYCFGDLATCADVILSKSINHGKERKRKLADSPDLGYDTGDSNNATPEGRSCHKRRYSGRSDHKK